MTPKQIVAHIKGMRSREDIDAIIKAAEARDSHLAQLEAEERWRRVWAKFSHLKKRDIVFVHKEPKSKQLSWLYGEALRVRQVKPRAKEIVVVDRHGRSAALSALMCESYKLSEEPTVAAFDNALYGDDLARKVKS